MKNILSIFFMFILSFKGSPAFSEPMPNCLCGLLPVHAAGDSVWYGTAGKRVGLKQEFTVKEIIAGNERPSTPLITIPVLPNFQDGLEDGRDYVVVIRNPKKPSLVACETVNVRPYYERRGRAFPGSDNPVECIGKGLPQEITNTDKVIYIEPVKQKKFDWSFKDKFDRERDLPSFTIWKDVPGNSRRVSMTYGRQESLMTFKNGIAHGWRIERSSSGSLSWSGNYVEGKRDGVFFDFYNQIEAEYKDGVLIKWKHHVRSTDPSTFKKDTSSVNKRRLVQKKPLSCHNNGAETTTVIRVTDKIHPELINKEFTCKNGLADGSHKVYDWLGGLISQSEMKDGFLQGKARTYIDGVLDSVTDFAEGEQVGPVYSYSNASENWDGFFDANIDPIVEMETQSDPHVGKLIARSLSKRKNLWNEKSRRTFIGLSIDHRKQFVPSLAYGPMPCNYSREWSCDVSTIRLSAFLGERKGFAIELTGGDYGLISDILSIGARFDKSFGGGPMINAELGVGYFTLLLRGTWFVPKRQGEVDVGLNFTYELVSEKKR